MRARYTKCHSYKPSRNPNPTHQAPRRQNQNGPRPTTTSEAQLKPAISTTVTIKLSIAVMRATSSQPMPAPSYPSVARAPPAKKLPARRLKQIHRARLSKAEVLDLIRRRYGSLTDFSHARASYSAISRATGMLHETVRSAILLFHKKGDRYAKNSMFGHGGGRPRTVPAHIEAELITEEALNDMRYLTLAGRAELIRRKRGLKVEQSVLGALYRRNGIWLSEQLGRTPRLTKPQKAALRQGRIAFARRLQRLLQRRPKRIIYMG